MTDAEMVRLVELLVKKWERYPPYDSGDRISHDTLESIIGTTVADTLLVVEGTFTVNDYEPAAAPALVEADPDWLDTMTGTGEPLRKRWWHR